MPNTVDNAITWVAERVGHAKREWLKATQPERSNLLMQLLGGESSLSPDLGASGTLDVAKTREALTVSWIYSDIDLIESEFSTADIEVKKIKGEQKVSVPNHPFEVRLRNPNPEFDLIFLWRYTIAWLMLRGNAAWFLAPRANGENDIAEIWPIRGDRIVPRPGKEEFVEYYVYTTNMGKVIKIDPRYVVHFMLPNPFSLYIGLSPLQAALLDMDSEIATGKWQKDSFVSGRGIPPAIVMLNEDMGDRDFAATSGAIREDFAAERKLIIARGGDIKVAQIGIPQRQMDLIGQRSFTRDSIDRVFLGVELHKSGSEAELREKRKIFKETKILALHRLICGQINVQLLHPFYGEEFFCEFEDLRAQDKALNVQERNVYWRVETINEARSELGKPEYKNPLLSGLGDIPVSLGTDPAFVAMLFGLSRTGSTPDTGNPDSPRRPPQAVGSLNESDAPVNILTNTASGQKALLSPSLDSLAAIEGVNSELRRWRTVASKEARAGRNPGLYKFSSDIIPSREYYYVKGLLMECDRTEESIKSVFDSAKERIATHYEDGNYTIVEDKAQDKLVEAIREATLELARSGQTPTQPNMTFNASFPDKVKHEIENQTPPTIIVPENAIKVEVESKAANVDVNVEAPNVINEVNVPAAIVNNEVNVSPTPLTVESSKVYVDIPASTVVVDPQIKVDVEMKLPEEEETFVHRDSEKTVTSFTKRRKYTKKPR